MHKGFLVKSFLAHQVIFTQGSHGDCAYLLNEGQVEISTTVEGRKKVLAILTPPSLFGEMALFLEDETRTATAMTLEDSKAVVIGREALASYMDNAPQAVSSILTVLVHRLKATTRKAGRAPNLRMGLLRVLHLFQVNGLSEVRYDSLVRHLSETFVVSGETMEELLAELVRAGRIAIRARDEDPGMRLVAFKTDDVLEGDDVVRLTKGMEV